MAGHRTPEALARQAEAVEAIEAEAVENGRHHDRRWDLASHQDRPTGGC